VQGGVDALTPRLIIAGTEYGARLLDISPVPLDAMTTVIASGLDESDAISTALDIILHGYPVGLPH
jgi:hypothetical protein